MTELVRDAKPVANLGLARRELDDPARPRNSKTGIDATWKVHDPEVESEAPGDLLNRDGRFFDRAPLEELFSCLAAVRAPDL